MHKLYIGLTILLRRKERKERKLLQLVLNVSFPKERNIVIGDMWLSGDKLGKLKGEFFFF